MGAVEVEGLPQVLKAIRDFTPDLNKRLRKDLTEQAQPIIKAAAARMPERPTSGWGQKGRTGFSRARAQSGMKVSLRASKRIRGVRGSYAVVEIVQNNAGGAIWDQAGTRGNYQPPTQRGAAFVAALNATGGRPQRGLWPASVGRRKDIARSFEATIEKAEDEFNRIMAASRSDVFERIA